MTPDQMRRFIAKLLIVPKGCWLWQAAKTPNGYGVMGNGGGKEEGNSLVHRLAYEHWKGPIPEGLHIDHLCKVRECANPTHLEAVTQQENNRRQVHANRVKEMCIRGHPFNEENTYNYIHTVTGRPARSCRVCRRLLRPASSG